MGEQVELAAAVAAFGVLIFFGGVAAWLKRKREVVRLREHVAAHAKGVSSGVAQSAMRPTDTGMTLGLNRRMGHTGVARQLQLQLTRANVSIGANQFILGQIALGSMLFLLGRYVLFSSFGTLGLLPAIGMAIPAVILPRFVINSLISRRVKKFESQLAQAVDIMAGSLQAGTSLPQSFELVSREMPYPIGEEFGRMMQETAFAVPLDQALVNMLDRMPSTDLEMLVTAINIQYKVGGNLSHILKTIAHTIRERVRIRGELNTLTAQARLSSYIISGMPVAVVLALMVISPNYIMKLFDPGVTRIMLIGGIMGIFSGFYVMKRIAAIEV